MQRRHYLIEAVFLAAFCGLVVSQSFVAPVVSLANNGDFGAMIGRFGLGPMNDGPEGTIIYAPTEYVFHPARYFVSRNISSELLLIVPALFIGWATTAPLFDIRIMGAIDAVMLITAFALLLPLTRGLAFWRRLIVLSILTVVLSDVHYVSHLNSFYTDVAAFLGLLFVVATGLRLMLAEDLERHWFAAFCVSACFLIASKPPHALLAVCLFAVALTAALRRPRNWTGYLAAGSLLAVGACTWALAPPVERARNLYTATFIRIPQVATDPPAALREMGLGDEYVPHLGHWAYQPGAPKEEWFLKFGQRQSYGRLALWYLRHPLWALQILVSDLRGPAARIRMPILGNYRIEDGFPPGAQAHSHQFWSSFRSRMLRLYPWHLPVWFAAYLAVFGVVLWRRRGTKDARFAALALVVGVMALMEFIVPVLADGADTDRHLFLFHALTDVSILLAATALANRPKSAPFPVG